MRFRTVGVGACLRQKTFAGKSDKINKLDDQCRVRKIIDHAYVDPAWVAAFLATQ